MSEQDKSSKSKSTKYTDIKKHEEMSRMMREASPSRSNREDRMIKEETVPHLKRDNESVISSVLSKTIICNNEVYCIQKELKNRSTFGKFYIGLNKKGEEVIFKQFLKSGENKKYYDTELQIYQILKDKKLTDGFLSLVDTYETDKANYIIIPRIKSNPKYKLNSLSTWNHIDKLKLLGFMALLVKKLHNVDICHRDIKISNFLINGNKLVLIDFSHSHYGIVEDEDVKRKCGTPRYSSPQFIDPKTVIDIQMMYANDIYSLGKVFYEIITGYTNRPIGKINENISDKLYNQEFMDKEIWNWKIIDNEKLRNLIRNMTLSDYKTRPSIEDVYKEITSIVKEKMKNSDS